MNDENTNLLKLILITFISVFTSIIICLELYQKINCILDIFVIYILLIIVILMKKIKISHSYQ